jgi:hypothetical protein
MSGYLYCFSNDSLKNLYKIGMTTQSVEEKLKDENLRVLCSSKFKIELSLKVNDVEKKEKILHQILEEYRSNSKKEFFEVSLEKIKLLFNLIKEEDIKSQNIFKEVKKNNLIEPKGIIFKKQAKDYYDEFINEYKDFLEVHKEYKDIYSKFYEWFENKYPKKDIPKLETLIFNMEKRE